MAELIQCTELADGTLLPMASAYDGQISVWSWELEAGSRTPAEYLALFADPAKTATITWHHGEEETSWTGFTRFAAIQIDGNGITRIRMMRPVEAITEEN